MRVKIEQWSLLLCFNMYKSKEKVKCPFFSVIPETFQMWFHTNIHPLKNHEKKVATLIGELLTVVSKSKFFIFKRSEEAKYAVYCAMVLIFLQTFKCFVLNKLFFFKGFILCVKTNSIHIFWHISLHWNAIGLKISEK